MARDITGRPPLNIQPQGLLDFLQLKNGGRNPQYFGEEIVPTWDLARHYLETNAIEGGANVPIASGNNALVQVEPPADFWRYNVNASLIWQPLNAADAFNGQFVILRPSDGRTYIAQPNQAWAGSGPGCIVQAPADAALTVREFGFSDFWVPPGFGVALRQWNATSTGGLASFVFRHRKVHFRQ